MDTMNMSDEEFEEYMNSGQMEEDLGPEVDDVAEEEIVTEETETIDEVEDSEQPVEDSVETAEEIKTEDEVTEGLEEENETTDEIVETEETSTPEVVEEEVVKSTDDVQKQMFKVKAVGGEFEFDEKEMTLMAARGMDYTKKTQELSKHRETLSILKEANITDTDLNLLADVLKGDKNAINSILKRTSISALDLDEESDAGYEPGNYGKSGTELDIDEAFTTLHQDKDGQIASDVISSQWDQESRSQILEGFTTSEGKKWGVKEIMSGLHSDVKDGTYEIVSQMATKAKALDGGNKTDFEYYMQAGGQLANQRVQATQVEQRQANDAQIKVEAEAKIIADVKAKKVAEDAVKVQAEKKKAAAVTRTAGANNVVDYLDTDTMSDDEFMAFMDKQIG